MIRNNPENDANEKVGKYNNLKDTQTHLACRLSTVIIFSVNRADESTKQSTMFKSQIQGGPKNVALYFCPYLHQLLIDLKFLSLAHSADNLQ